jgi:hypothetical protein
VNDLVERIAEIEARARLLDVADGRRVQALNACADARDGLIRYERSMARAAWAVEAEVDHVRGGWAIQQG